MMKKFLLGALTILFTLCMVGCGGGDKPADKPAAPAEKKEVSADKAIVTYAELIATGESANDIGLTEEEKAERIALIERHYGKYDADADAKMIAEAKAAWNAAQPATPNEDNED